MSEQTAFSASTELPSWNDWERQNAEREGGEDFSDDELEDGFYQFAIVHRSPIFDDQYNEGKKNVNIRFSVVYSDDPSDLGKVISQWFKVSSHPMGDMFSLLKAVAGGELDPDRRPRLSDLDEGQFKAAWGTKIYQIDGKMFEKVKLQSFTPARNKQAVLPRIERD